MADIRNLIVDLQRRGIELVAVDGRLRSRAAPGAIDAACAALIRENKDAIVAFLERRATDAAPLVALERGPTAPLSANQRRLWLVDRIEGSAAYVMPLSVRLTGDLEIAALQAALDTLVLRHEVLRTVLTEHDGSPLQHIMAPRPVPLVVQDLRELSEAEREHTLQALRRDCASAGFDLSVDLMLRATLVRLSDRTAVMLLAVHHIAMDGWSIQLMLDEFASFYNAFRAGADPQGALAALPLQYADYAIWQERQSAQGATRSNLAYWCKQLADLPPVHGIPTDSARPPIKGDAALRRSHRLDAVQCAPLRALAARHDATLFMVVHAALALVFARWSNRADVVIGTPVSGRAQPELAGLIGFFANTLVLRTQVAPAIDFDTLLAHCKTTCLAAYEHQEVAFDAIVEALRPDRSRSYSPVFQLMLAYQGAASRAPALDGLTADLMTEQEVRGPFDISITARERDGGLELHWDFDPALFLPASIERMMDAMVRVLACAGRDSTAPIGSAVLLGDGDAARLDALNATRQPYPSGRCLHHLIEQQAAATPERDAILSGTGRLTYAQVNGKANALARILRERGLQTGQSVAVVMGPGPEAAIGFLAIMKAGGVFAPLDCAWPAARLKSVLRTLGNPLVLVDAVRQIDGLQDGERAIRVHESDLSVAADLELALDAQAPLYITHVAGSTGLPKGAINRHQGIVNRLSFMSRQFGDAGHVVLQAAQHGSDAAVWQLFWPLCHGGAVVLPGVDERVQPARLARLIELHGVTVTASTPALLRLFAAHLIELGDAAGAPWRLQHLIVEGEEMTAGLASLCRRAMPAVTLHHVHGASEVSGGAVSYTVPAAVEGRVPIGKPIDNVVVAIAGPDLQPLPIGAPGEILFGGDCVGLGYVGREAETHAAFIELAQPLYGCRRFYRTGDLGRYRADGLIEFLGRIDSPVTIRGLRVDLGEVDMALEAQDAVRQAYTLVDGEGDSKRVVSYVVPAQWPMADAGADQVRAALALRLPDYLLPAAILFVQALPLGTSGKIDRRALPRPQQAEVRPAHVAPEGEVENILAAIWSELFPNESIGRLDNFFALGGHSLLAMRMVARVRRDLNLELPLSVVFSRPRLDNLAAWCANASRDAALEIA